jgi:hypothetical protein
MAGLAARADSEIFTEFRILLVWSLKIGPVLGILPRPVPDCHKQGNNLVRIVPFRLV